MRVLIVGATGTAGKAVAEALMERCDCELISFPAMRKRSSEILMV